MCVPRAHEGMSAAPVDPLIAVLGPRLAHMSLAPAGCDPSAGSSLPGSAVRGLGPAAASLCAQEVTRYYVLLPACLAKSGLPSG